MNGTISSKPPRFHGLVLSDAAPASTHFRGQTFENRHFVAPLPGSEAKAWEALTSALGKKRLSVGERCTGPEGAPAFSGRAEYVSEDPYDALLLIDKPAPGVAALGTFNMGGDSSMVPRNWMSDYQQYQADEEVRDSLAKRLRL